MCLSILTPFPFLFMSLKKSSAVSLWSKAEVNKETDLKFAGVISDTESKNQNLKQGKFSNFNSNIFFVFTPPFHVRKSTKVLQEVTDY